jgi:endonuclease/exonuclease/phosphatase family metal-dependent hydrolase
MKKRLIVWLLALTSVAIVPRLFAGAEQPGKLRVMSYNVRCLHIENNPQDLWWFRVKHLVENIRNQDPDLIGMQEVYTAQANDLQRLLPGYAWFGVPRDDGKKKGERCPIFYRKDRFELLDWKTFWLSETPDTPGSVSWKSGCKRVVTWAKFRDKQTGKVFFHFNTHFDNASPKAREMSAVLLVERVRQIAGNAQAFVTGDFNTGPDSAPVKTITAVLQDARSVSASAPLGPEKTSWSFKVNEPPEGRIDYIFISKGISALGYEAIDKTYGKGRRPSDHIAIRSDLLLP